MRTSVASLPLLGCLCLAGPALSLTIDNFEQGDFNVVDVAPGPTLGQQSGLAGANVIGGVRLVRANATNGGTTTASLTTTAGPDGSLVSFADAAAPFGSGDVAFLYDGIADGAFNGVGGALNLDLSSFATIDVSAAATPGIADLQLTLWSATTSQSSLLTPIVSGTTSFLLGSFGSIDLTDVKAIRLSLFGLDPSDLVDLQEISAVPEPSTGFLLAIGLASLALRKTRSR